MQTPAEDPIFNTVEKRLETFGVLSFKRALMTATPARLPTSRVTDQWLPPRPARNARRACCHERIATQRSSSAMSRSGSSRLCETAS
jgi:hypothetical protein